MSTEEIKSIKEQLKQNHDEMMGRITALDEKIKPISQIYEQARGFGKVISWIARWILTPIIIFLGAILTVKKLTE